MERQTARAARQLVASERTPVKKAGGLAFRLVVVAIIVVVAYLVITIATGKA